MVAYKYAAQAIEDAVNTVIMNGQFGDETTYLIQGFMLDLKLNVIHYEDMLNFSRTFIQKVIDTTDVKLTTFARQDGTLERALTPKAKETFKEAVRKAAIDGYPSQWLVDILDVTKTKPSKLKIAV